MYFNTITFLVLIVLIFFHSLFAFPVPDDAQTGPNENDNTNPETNPVTQNESPSANKKDSKKSNHGLEMISSPRCGVGYRYNTVSHICLRINIDENAQKRKSQENGGGEEVDDKTGNGENKAAEERETMEYVEPKMISIFPLECGMNYRYLKKVKICKPITAPKSSESEEQNDTNNDEEENEDY